MLFFCYYKEQRINRPTKFGSWGGTNWYHPLPNHSKYVTYLFWDELRAPTAIAFSVFSKLYKNGEWNKHLLRVRQRRSFEQNYEISSTIWAFKRAPEYSAYKEYFVTQVVHEADLFSVHFPFPGKWIFPLVQSWSYFLKFMIPTLCFSVPGHLSFLRIGHFYFSNFPRITRRKRNKG